MEKIWNTKMRAGLFKIFSFIFLTSLIYFNSFAQNPICPPGIYIADPSARIWGDGKLYIYGSTDESCDYYCSWHHDVMYTADMLNWGFAENVFATSRDSRYSFVSMMRRGVPEQFLRPWQWFWS